ncbi:hypothetical protein SNE35_31125 [Paucibacter sp. R3-3]|uniref:Uncharacterized protein n=1 Tax=Roseateles agri TaxID=3098619 RepID=A0ABU5DUC2_9BURK|nr:hypothetical protein [Paucibacter sp. R3-3]MDY0748992.1 hypothetical protein [Paucibacter sp. R3-3]
MNPLTRYRLMETGIQTLKTVLVEEAAKRPGRTVEQWTTAEVNAMWAAARDFAEQHGLRVPLLADVVRVERQACGHCDYGSKWALYVTGLMMAAKPVAV